MNNLFNNNLNPNQNRNPFANNNNQPLVNPLFNQPQNQNNQSISNQPSNPLLNQLNQPANKNIPQNPIIQDSLLQKYSFASIRQKLIKSQKLTQQELNHITKKGLSLFKPDPYKSNYFLATKSKQTHIGFGHDVLIHQGEVPRQPLIQGIWIKLIKHFAHICQTNEMNGYFIIKQILIKEKYYEKFYRPKPGLGNKVFQRNDQFLLGFYSFATLSNRKVNINGHIYKHILQEIVNCFITELTAFLDIVEIVGVKKNQNAQQQQLGGQNRPGLILSTLKFQDLDDANIINELWKTYKDFAISTCPTPQSLNEKVDTAKQKFLLMKKQIFFRISRIITSLLASNYSQEKIIEKQPLPIIEAIKFITNDIQVVQNNNRIQPNLQGEYIESGLSLILAGIPFASFILGQTLLTSYFTISSERAKFAQARQAQSRKRILEELKKVNLAEFQPLKIWAELELKRITLYSTGQNARRLSEPQKERRIQAAQTWEDYFNKNDSNLNIFEEQKWHNWIALWAQNISIDGIIGNKSLRNFMVYYCKRSLKSRAREFFQLWNQIDKFEASQAFKDIESTIRNLPQNLTQQEKEKTPIYSIPRKILKNLELYTTGCFLKSITDSDYTSESLSAITTLLKSENEPEENYTNQILSFISKVLPGPDQQIHQCLVLEIVISQIAGTLKISCRKKAADNTFLEYDKMQGLESVIVDGMFMLGREVKFLCQLIIKSVNELDLIQRYIFDSSNQADLGQYIPGLKICIFLCKILANMKYFDVGGIKCLRYLIRAVDWLFNTQHTRQLILYALSIVFPYNFDKKLQIQNSSRTLKSNLYRGTSPAIFTPTQSVIKTIMNLLQNPQQVSGQHLRQLHKLRKILSHHFYHMLKYSDSVDEYFTIQKRHHNEIVYRNIQTELSKWQFDEAERFLKQPKKRFRSTDWFYTIAKVMKFRNLLAIDVESIIECLKKMRIQSYESSAYEPMAILRNIIQRGTIQQQLLSHLKPVISQQRQNFQIENFKMATYKPTQIQVRDQLGFLYGKYKNRTILQFKNINRARNQQKQLVRTICLWVRFVQELLKMKLERLTNYYPLIQEMTSLNQIITKLTDKQKLYHYQLQQASQDNINNSNKLNNISTTKQKVNLIASIISLLNLYHYKIKLPPSVSYIRDRYPFLLDSLQRQSINSFAYEFKYKHKDSFMLRTYGENQVFYQFYSKDMIFVTEKFFDSVLYEMTDFSFDNDNTSLQTSIFTIVQLLFQNSCSHLVVQCLYNYSFPHVNAEELENYSIANKFLVKESSKNLIPILFFHIKQFMCMEGSRGSGLMILSSRIRTLEALTFMLDEALFAKQIRAILKDIGKQLIVLILNQQIYTSHNNTTCSKSIQINLLNKISLFILKLLQTMKSTLTQQQFQTQIIKNFLIHPNNILRRLLERMTQMTTDYNNLDKMIFVQSGIDLYANYLMQVNITRNALYRATYDCLLRVFLIVVEYMPKDEIAHVIKMVIFGNYQLIISKPRQLKHEPEIVAELELSPLERIDIMHDVQRNISATVLSEQVTEFRYCVQTGFRKYGPNFFYNFHTAFHKIKSQCKNAQQLTSERKIRPSQLKKNLRKKIYMIQLINCIKSLTYTYQSMVKSYFQILQLLSNTSPYGQNLSLQSHDHHLPQKYLNQTITNKYTLKNKFSFSRSLHLLKSIIAEESITSKIVHILDQFCAYSFQRQQQQIEDVIFREEVQTRLRGIPRNMISSSPFLDTKVVDCINPDQVINVIKSMLNPLVQNLSSSQNVTESCRQLIDFLNRFTSVFERVPCSFRLTLQCYSSILTHYSTTLDIQLSCLKQSRVSKQIQQLGKQKEKQLVEMNRARLLEIQSKIIKNLSQVLYHNLQTQKPLNYLPGYDKSLDKSSKNMQFGHISENELYNNIFLVSSICTQVLSQLPQGLKPAHLISQMSETLSFQKKIIRTINYILKLIIQKLPTSQNLLTTVSVLALCNRFYMVTSLQPVTIWPFHAGHFLSCEQIMLRQVRTRDESQQSILERLIALDSLSTFVLSNENSSLQMDILSILIKTIKVKDNNNFSKGNKSSQSLSSSKKENILLDASSQIIEKRYDFQMQPAQIFQLSTVLEYKKLLMALLVLMQPKNWTIFGNSINAIFLEILKFHFIDFTTDRLRPTRPVQQRLTNLIVSDLQQKKSLLSKQKPSSKFLRQTYHIPLSQSSSLIPRNNPSSSKQLFHQSPQISLFQFICFVHYNQLIHNYLLILKTGIRLSSIMDEFQGCFLDAKDYFEIWANLQQKIIKIHQYYSEQADKYLENLRLVDQLTKIYNYIAEDPAYLVQFDYLTMFFDKIDQNYVATQIITSIVQFCTIVPQLTLKWRKIQWKQGNHKSYSRQRIICLNRCIQLLQKHKVINAFKQLDIFQTLYEKLRKSLASELALEKDQPNFNTRENQNFRKY